MGFRKIEQACDIYSQYIIKEAGFVDLSEVEEFDNDKLVKKGKKFLKKIKGMKKKGKNIPLPDGENGKLKGKEICNKEDVEEKIIGFYNAISGLDKSQLMYKKPKKLIKKLMKKLENVVEAGEENKLEKFAKKEHFNKKVYNFVVYDDTKEKGDNDYELDRFSVDAINPEEAELKAEELFSKLIDEIAEGHDIDIDSIKYKFVGMKSIDIGKEEKEVDGGEISEISGTEGILETDVGVEPSDEKDSTDWLIEQLNDY